MENKNESSTLHQGLPINESRRNYRRATRQKLITHSVYNGVWLDSLQCMDGYGVYTFPDGSEYRGYFKRGHFHGYGTLHLAPPYGFTFKGTFINGHLDEIDEMWFDDGLSVDAEINGWLMDFSSWKYCTKDDRRYAEEQINGLRPIGPFSMLTQEQPTRKLFKNCYDVAEGIYNPATGLITERPAPFPRICFVSDKENIAWIFKNCRHGPMTATNLCSKVCHKIIRNNLNSEFEIGEYVRGCNYDQDQHLKNYFEKLCPAHVSTAHQLDENKEECQDSVGVPLSNSSSICSSFSTTSLDVDVEEKSYLTNDCDRYTQDRNLSDDTPTMIKNYVVFNRFSINSRNS